MSRVMAASKLSNRQKAELDPPKNIVEIPNSDITDSLEDDYSAESEESVKIILEESKSRNSFLMWTGVYFLIYLFFIHAMALFVLHDTVRARYWFRALRSSIVGWIALGFAIGVKLIASFAGGKIRPFIIIMFALDILLTMYAFLGIYFFSENYQPGEYRYNLYEFMVIVPIMCSSSMVGFIISTFIPSKRLRYNPIIGFALMEVFLVGAIAACMKLWKTGNITETRYLILLISLSILNFYIAVNSYLVMNYRTVKFYEGDYNWNFFCYFTDWFSFFWADIVSNTKFMKKRRRRAARKAKELAKQAKRDARKKAKEEKNESEEKSEEKKSVSEEEDKPVKQKKEKTEKKRQTKENSDIAEVKDSKKDKKAKDKKKKDKKERKAKADKSEDSDIEK